MSYPGEWKEVKLVLNRVPCRPLMSKIEMKEEFLLSEISQVNLN